MISLKELKPILRIRDMMVGQNLPLRACKINQVQLSKSNVSH